MLIVLLEKVFFRFLYDEFGVYFFMILIGFIVGFLGFFSRSRENIFWVLLDMLPTHQRAPLGNMPWEKPIHLGISRIHSQYTYVDDSHIVSLGFHSKDNYSPKGIKKYGSFFSMTDPTTITLRYRFLQNLKEGWHDHLTDWIRLLQTTV